MTPSPIGLKFDVQSMAQVVVRKNIGTRGINSLWSVCRGIMFFIALEDSITLCKPRLSILSVPNMGAKENTGVARPGHQKQEGDTRCKG
jgi:hypothetical protein